MYRIRWYATVSDCVYDKEIVREFRVDYTFEKMERFVKWYHALTGYIPIIDRV
jgi:hypothetical protein